MKKINFKNLKKKKILIPLGVLFLLFIILTVLVCTNTIEPLDNAASSFIISIRSPELTNTMNIITNISGSYALIVFTTLFIILIKKKKYPLAITINLIAVFITSQLAKAIVERDRPLDMLVSAPGYSYPSGHSMVGLAYFSFLSYLVIKYIPNKIVKIIRPIVFTITILLVGFSRIYLGVHYLSDVLAGFLLGAIYLIIFINIYPSFICFTYFLPCFF